MAWIEGIEEQRFVVRAGLDETVDYFASLKRFSHAFSQLESQEELGDSTWRWTLVEKSEKGIIFQRCYDVRYARIGDSVRWHTVRGNMCSTGTVMCLDVSEGTHVHYTETLACDLPIPRLAAKIFRPIVAREIRSGVGDFLERSRQILTPS